MSNKKKEVVSRESEKNKQAVKFSSVDGNSPTAPGDILQVTVPSDVSDDEWVEQLQNTFGTYDDDSLNLYINQIDHIVAPKGKDHLKMLNMVTPLLRAIGPLNELEGMLALQMVGTHCLAMEMMGKAMHPEQTVDNVNLNLNQATKLTRTFIAQMGALDKHRGKGQQKMTVEHVHVNEGGQAVIGNIEGGGSENKK